MIYIEHINDKGRLLAERIAGILGENAKNGGMEQAHEGDAIVFIGAMGICVRKVMPLISDKHCDPAVICIDTCGKYVIPILSGHVGGANDLAREIASAIGAEAVVTTQSDNLGLWALDTLARRFGWAEAFARMNINDEIAIFVNGEPTALLLDIDDEGTQYLRDTKPEHVTIVSNASEITPDRFRLAIIVSPMEHILSERIRVLQYIPQCLHVGIGLAHQAEPANEILGRMLMAISMAGICIESIADFNTIDVKADEPLVKLLQADGMKVNFYTSDQLAAISVPNPSDTVSKHVGTPSVSEAAAILGEGNTSRCNLVIEKQKGENWTLAAAVTGKKKGHIEIVGAGPGDPDLVSVRGRRFLEQADLILYAGSLVPRELTDCHKPGATVRSSADLNLEEQFLLMKQFYDEGKLVVRLHTGDPCIYGAIQEQMAFFDRYDMDYHITPGISSFLAAAAELQSQFTIPERCQTIILTRGEGRTPMPDKEKLYLLAQHQSTMCIFLSASIVEDVQRQLLEGGYPPETPVAACHKLTWKDQRIYRGQLKDLAKILKENHLTLTTMIVVGEAIDNREGLSKLYDGKFTHLFRKGK